MSVIRVGPPALIGAILVFIAVQATRTGLGDDGQSAIQAVRGGLLPAAVGVALLLAAVAIARRSRAGYLLGIVVAVSMVLSGAWLIMLEIPFLAAGGISGSFGVIGVVVAVTWAFLWAGYGLAVRRARGRFAPAWQADDRRFGIVLGALAIFTTGAYVGLMAVDSTAGTNRAIDEARAQELVNGTAFEVRVADVTVEPGSATTGGPRAVATLTLDITIQAAEAYELVVAPGLCLTDLATYADPAFKPDVFCWGTPSPAGILGTAFSDLSIPSSERTVQLVLERGSSPCAFAPGAWSAQLLLAPRLTNSGAIGPAPAIYARTATFEVEDESAPPSSAGTSQGSACLASQVSR